MNQSFKFELEMWNSEAVQSYFGGRRIICRKKLKPPPKNTHGCHSPNLIIQFFSICMLFCCFPKSTFVMIYACVNMICCTKDKISSNGLMLLKKEFRQIAAWRNRKKISSNCSNDIKQSDHLTRFYPSYFILLTGSINQF